MDRPSESARAHLLGLAAVLLAFLFSASVRIHTALNDHNFDANQAEGLLKSDPALLYHFTQEIAAAGGGTPASFRADPRIHHPEPTDVLSEFTVGQEYLVAWCYSAFGGDMPLHVFCVWLMAALASLAVFAVYGLAWECTRNVGWAVLAAGFFCLLPANYRTIGFVLVREDLSFPLFALHLYLALRAWRVATPLSFGLAGVPLALALATWHALRFFFLLELAAVLLFFFLRPPDEEEAQRRRFAWALLVAPALAGVLVPALRVSGLLVSAPMVGALALTGALWLRGARPERLPGRRAAVLATLVLLAVALFQGFVGPSSYAHVYDVLLAKLRHFGALPEDPDTLSFDARLLWQGPFQTLSLSSFAPLLGWGTLVLVASSLVPLPARLRGASGGSARLLLVFLGGGLVFAWLFERTVILPGVLLPVALTATLARWKAPRAAVSTAVVALAFQLVAFFSFIGNHVITWYLPPGQRTEIRTLVEWIRENVEPDAAIAADFINSTAILAHTGRPIALQPKYETDRSRRRAEEFLVTFFHGTPGELRELVGGRWDCDYVLIDRYTLGTVSRYAGGLGEGEAPGPETPAASFLSQDEEVLAGVPGFELVYRSPDTIQQFGGEPYDFFRLYRVGP